MPDKWACRARASLHQAGVTSLRLRFPIHIRDSQAMNTSTNEPRENTSRMVCLAMISISWAILIANVVVNVRNGQRLSIDDYGWFLNTLIIGMLSIAPTAC